MDFLQKFKILIISISLLALAACGEGCIEPEDFGGYDTQIINVSADGINYEECSWSMDDSGSFNLGDDLELPDLLDSGDIAFLKNLGCAYEIWDESRNAYDTAKYDHITVDGGQTINLFSNEEKRRCFIEAEKLCKNRKLAIFDGSYNSWGAATDKEENGGVRLSRNSKIFIKAKGTITSGVKNKIFAKLDETPYSGHSLNEQSEPFLYDVSGGDTKQITIVGQINGNDGSPSDISGTQWPENAHKGFSRLYAYIKKFPPNYRADNSETESENQRAVGDYPIDPDPRLWNCFDSGSDGEDFNLITQYASRNQIGNNPVGTNCYSLNYKRNGYYENLGKRNVTNDEVVDPEKSLISKVNDNIFAEKYYYSEYDIIHPRNLGKYGGAILHNQLGSDDGDILSADILSAGANNQGGDISIDSDRLYILVTYNSNNCSPTGASSYIDISDTSYIDKRIILYPDQILTFDDGSSGDCNSVSYRYIRAVTLQESGYVRFFNDNSACNINIAVANIGNNGNYSNDEFEGSNSNYINYKAISVEEKPDALSFPTIREFLDDIGNETYLRKGQVILFLPDSWKWNSDNGCDINTLMHIEHRPAVICKNFSTEYEAVNMGCSYDATGATQSCSNINVEYGCIDFTDYRGYFSEQFSNNDINDILNLDGVKEVPFFGQDISYNNGSAGNFTASSVGNGEPVGNHLALNGQQSGDGLYELSSKNSVIFTESGRLEFLFLDGLEELINPNVPAVSDEGFKIKLGYYNEFSNGENLQMVLCSDNSAGGNCNSSGPLQKIIIKDDESYDNQYAFSMSGTFKDISTSERKDYYMHDGTKHDGTNIDDDKNLLLAFNVYNPNMQNSIEKNCLISNPDGDCKESCVAASGPSCLECDGVRIANPYYQNQYCDYRSRLMQKDGAAICCSDEFTPDDPDASLDDQFDECSADSSTHSDPLSSPNKTCRFLSPSCHYGKICVGPYYDIEGSYQVTVKIPNVEGIDSRGIISGIIVPFSEFMLGTDEKDGFIERSYKKTVQNDLFIQLVQLFSVLFITFFGIAYFMGLAEMKQGDLMMRILKLGIIYFLISPNSWIWYKMFFVDVFTDGISYIVFLMSSTFDRDPEILNAINNQDFSDKALLFQSSDKIFRILFDDTIHKKILAIIFGNFFGIVYVILIYWAICQYLLAFFTFIVLFLTAQSLIYIFLIFGPIFIILMLFSKTSRYFHSWWEQMLGLGLQQALLVLFLSFFNGIIYELIMLNFNYKVCWGSVWSLPIPGMSDIFDFWMLPSSIGINPNGSEVNSAPQLMAILFIFFMCRMMYDFIEFVQNLGSTIVGNLNIVTPGLTASSNATHALRATSKYAMNSMIKKTGIGELYKDRRDAFLDKHFDSGKIADTKYKEQQKTKKIMESKRNALKKAGDKSDAQYLKDHKIKDSSKLTDKDKLAMQRRRKAAIEDKAKNMGIDDKELERLKNFRAGQFVSDKDRKKQAQEQLTEEGVNIDSKEGRRRIQEMVEESRNRDENSPLKAAYAALQNKIGYNADRILPTSRTVMESKYYNNQEEREGSNSALADGESLNAALADGESLNAALADGEGLNAALEEKEGLNDDSEDTDEDVIGNKGKIKTFKTRLRSDPENQDSSF
jgi:type IV secretory pathway VirB6-like protein